MVGKGYSVIVPVEVPPDIGDHELLNLEKYPDKLEVLREKSLKTLERYKGHKDVIISFVRNGKPIILNDTVKVSSLFSCKRDTIRYCLGSGWSSYEVSAISWHMDRILPIIESFYGQAMMKKNPWGNPWFRIVKDPSLPTSFMCPSVFAPICKSVFSLDPPCTPFYYLWDDNGYIVLNISSFDTCSTCYSPILLTHEVVHAFRGNRILFWSQFEEGHAEAVSMLVHKILCLNYGRYCASWNSEYTFDPAYVFHQYLNLPFIGTNATLISFESTETWYSPIIPLRYKAFSYLWIKVYLTNTNFFKNLNDSLCEKSILPFWIDVNSYNEYKLMSNEAFGSYTIEGMGFINWFNSQPAFYNNYSSLFGNLAYQLAMFPYSYSSYGIGLDIYYYKRRNDFSLECPGYCEEPMANKTLRFLAWDYDGRIFIDTLINTDMSGRASVYVDVGRICSEQGQSGKCRIKVEVCDTLYCKGNINVPPIYSELVFSFPSNLWRNIFGAVGAEKRLTIYTPSPTRDTNGAFFSPNTPYRGSFTVYYDSDFLGHMETRWVKDSLVNFIYPGLYTGIPFNRNLRIPPAKPQNIRVVFLDTLSDTVVLRWDLNREADFERYNVFASFDNSPFISIATTPNNYISLNTYPCISNKFFITPMDIFGNMGEPSDTVEIFYTYGGWTCLTSPPNIQAQNIYTKYGNTLYFHNNEPIPVKIFDPSGRLVFNKRVRNEKIRLNKGVYFIFVNGNVKKEVLK